MKRTLAVTGIFLALVVSTHEIEAQTEEPSTSPARPQKAAPSDVASVDSIIVALYDVISGPAGKKRDWARFRSLFVPGARLIPIARDPQKNVAARVLDVEGYVNASGNYLETNGFFEKEIARRTERFGNLAHVFSTYDSRNKMEDPKPFARGINSIQLMYDGSRWWIVTIFWESERPDNPIPSEYLKSAKN